MKTKGPQFLPNFLTLLLKASSPLRLETHSRTRSVLCSIYPLSSGCKQKSIVAWSLRYIVVFNSCKVGYSSYLHDYFFYSRVFSFFFFIQFPFIFFKFIVSFSPPVFCYGFFKNLVLFHVASGRSSTSLPYPIIITPFE